MLVANAEAVALGVRDDEDRAVLREIGGGFEEVDAGLEDGAAPPDDSF